MGMNTELWGNSLRDWLWAGGLLVVSAVVLGLLLRLLAGSLRRWASRTETDVDDLIADLLNRTKFLIVVVVAGWISLRSVVLPDSVSALVDAVLKIVVLLQAGIWLVAVLRYLIDRFLRVRFADDPSVLTSLGALRVVGTILIWVLLALTALATFGVEVGALLAGLGVGGIAVALAVQGVLSDLFGALSIILDKPFQVGDYIVFGDSEGTVEHVGLRTTRVRALSGEQLVVANSDLLSSRIQNFGRMDQRRVRFVIGVEYGTPRSTLERIPALLQEAVDRTPDTRFDRAHLRTFADSAVEFEVVYYMDKPDFVTMLDAQEQVNLAIYDAFGAEGIEFAFPSRTVYVRQPEEEPGPEATPDESAISG